MALPKIDVPRYPVVLPSTGKEYTMRPYLVKEEKVLLLALESQDPKQIALAVRNLINLLKIPSPVDPPSWYPRRLARPLLIYGTYLLEYLPVPS